jgi:hypothetical protein
VLLGLLTGALLSGLLIATVADAVPVLPLTALVLTVVLGSRRDQAQGDGHPAAQGPGPRNVTG